MNLTFWAGLIILVGGVLMYVLPFLVSPWAWIILAIIGAVLAIVGTIYGKPSTASKKKK
ncbi:MAG TPA: hypothetical protein PLX55_02125 [bacterium]|jgi:VIT1/CCC1 family predicted Fe2+/Mn2+ transporter|nr:hypothetical protein [bacterium]HOR57314.1 hypothetical protein [bacterium]HPL56151.1 hypothetical protein [bacterium]HPM27940.1 hypothetical protein [bacterium]